MKLSDFGTERMPLHASSLPSLLRCPHGEVIKLASEDESGQAADTGSAVHLAVAAFHTYTKGEIAAAIREMEAHLPEFPLADLGTAEQHFRSYAYDPRNKEAKVILCEEKIQVTLPPPEGQTETVEIIGTVDQVRDENGRLIVCDVKTGGSYEGDEMLAHYAAQLAAYQVGASTRLSKPVPSACIIRTRDYWKAGRHKEPKPGPVFWYASWTYEDAVVMLDHVRHVVGDVRSGRIRVAPSPDNCRWCPGGGIANCLRRRFV